MNKIIELFSVKEKNHQRLESLYLVLRQRLDTCSSQIDF